MKRKKLPSCLSRIPISPKQLHQFIFSPSMWPNSLNKNWSNKKSHILFITVRWFSTQSGVVKDQNDQFWQTCKKVGKQLFSLSDWSNQLFGHNDQRWCLNLLFIKYWSWYLGSLPITLINRLARQKILPIEYLAVSPKALLKQHRWVSDFEILDLHCSQAMVKPMIAFSVTACAGHNHHSSVFPNRYRFVAREKG